MPVFLVNTLLFDAFGTLMVPLKVGPDTQKYFSVLGDTMVPFDWTCWCQIRWILRKLPSILWKRSLRSRQSCGYQC